jgi:hypothetical protein
MQAISHPCNLRDAFVMFSLAGETKTIKIYYTPKAVLFTLKSVVGKPSAERAIAESW